MTTKILIVEDESLLRMLAVDLVEDAGFVALEAADADEAIALLQTNSDIRIVMTDIDMPGSMDGLMLAAAVRDRWPPISIIVVSGKHRPTSEELPEGGVFFSKPYDLRKMTEQLQEMAA
ncbi:response regulator [Rhizobium sp. S163]|uniref:response regulator n=1 Tax=Rhizobium sp. S163 TaxID=3055039 RepID=UPI0025A95C88|nr:response regulator [Rhizobium sp. S163]MDM9644856.1 response regulator [Rhizobium sp. S163]